MYGEDVDGTPGAGAVNVLYGMPGVGLTAAGDQIWHQDIAGAKGVANPGDHFGAAVGDFDGNGVNDLAIGVPI